MKIQYDTPEEYDYLYQAVHDGIIYWKKVRQMCQGKINMNVDGSETHYSEQYAVDMMVQCAQILDTLEKSPHPVWNDTTNSYELSVEEYPSVIITKCNNLVPKVDLGDED